MPKIETVRRARKQTNMRIGTATGTERKSGRRRGPEGPKKTRIGTRTLAWTSRSGAKTRKPRGRRQDPSHVREAEEVESGSKRGSYRPRAVLEDWPQVAGSKSSMTQ